MYNPDHFQETDRDALFDLIEAAPLGVLITTTDQGLDANHIPFDLNRADGRLACHVARNNPVWQQLSDGDEVLVVFRAGESYISPNWYPSKAATHKQVPTWNYRVVHVHGRVTVHDNPAFVRRNVARLTRRHEATMPDPWKMGDAPAEYLDLMVAAIVGLEVDITRIEGKLKLGQNKDTADIQGAADGLVARGEAVIGPAMQAVAATKSKG